MSPKTPDRSPSSTSSSDERGFAGLGRALRYLRLQQDKKQYRVATTAGITRGMLCAYEKGKQLPSLDSLGKLLEALDSDLVKLQWALNVVNRRSPESPRAESTRQAAASRKPARSTRSVDLYQTLGIDHSLAPGEEEALQQMLSGFLHWVRLLQERAEP